MSLINKMLQDLDARGSAPGDAIPPHIQPVARAPRRPRLRVMTASAAIALAGVALAWLGWHRYQATPSSNADKPAAAKAPATLAPGQGMTSTIRSLPMQPAAGPQAMAATPPASAAAPVAAPAAPLASASQAPDPAPEPRAAAPQRQRPAQASATPARRVVATTPASAATDGAAPKSVAPVEPDGAEARAIRQALVLELQARAARKGAAPREPRAAGGHQDSAPQRAEGDYRRALASLQEGRMGETIAFLERALSIDPGHEAARETLVGLLVEAKRPDEAMQQLQQGLARDPRQPALAMLLARLQIERGGSGIETLMRTLPYAGADPDYHAFLAGALQRQQRHAEAAAEYLAALRAVPGNGVWWMGLGISLQAEKRNAEALAAFRKAQAGGQLSQELQAFVERQVRQLER